MKKFIKPFLIASFVLSFFSFVLWQRHIPATERMAGASGITRIFDGLERSWYDFKFQAKPAEIAKRVVVAEIDDASLARYGRWPWPRATYAEIINRLYALGAETVAFDVVFAEPELTAEWLDYVIQTRVEMDERSVKEKAELSGEQIQVLKNNMVEVGERIFAKSLRKTNTVLGYLWEGGSCSISSETNFTDPAVLKKIKEAGQISSDDYFKQFGKLVGPGDSASLPGFPVIRNDSKVLFETFSCPVGNRISLTSSAGQEGFFNARADPDGIFRRAILVGGFNVQQLETTLGDEIEFLNENWIKGATFFPSLSLRAVLAYLDKVDTAPEINDNLDERFPEFPEFSVNLKTYSSGSIGVENIEIHRKNGKINLIDVDDSGALPLRFYGSQNTRRPSILKVSLGRLIEREMSDPNEPPNVLYHPGIIETYGLNPSRPLEKMIVLIGPTSVGVYDLRPNPVDFQGAGVYLHATAAARMLDKILDGSETYSMKDTSLQTSLMILWVLSMIIALVVTFSNGFSSLWLVFVFLGAGLYFDYWVFVNKSVVVDAVSTLVGAVAVFAAILAYKYFTEGKDRAYLKGAFEKYVSPDLVKSIISDPKKLNLGGEKKELSVLFSDVRGFTSISEKMSASELAQFMNDYLTPMTEIVIEERGTIDKYMGDAIMAIFGAPVPYEEHARMAVRAGLRMLEKLDLLRVEWEAKGLPPIDIGVGVNTGDMSVGNMGSTRIFSYTVMGDSVNLGSRLEGLTKEYGVRFIVSASTKEHLKGEFICRELDRVKVKGKLEPVVIFEVLGETTGPDAAAHSQKAEIFETALRLYYDAKFKEAQVKFDELKAQDPTSEMYSSRCALWMESPPEEGWDGSWTMKTK